MMVIEIVAEIGINHGGDRAAAMELVARAADAGADTVKFQHALEGDMVRGGERPAQGCWLPLSDLETLKNYAESGGLRFLCTPFGYRALDDLLSIGVDRLKIGSMEAPIPAFFSACWATGLPLVVSTGKRDIRDFPDDGRLTLLHCVSAYPPDDAELNLLRLSEVRPEYVHVGLGYSNHTPSTTPCVVAAALGAELIEAHFMLPGQNCVDKAVSMGPTTFEMMVRRVREAERML